MTTASTDSIDLKIENAIIHQSHVSAGKVHFQTNAGRVRLTGRVNTWFEKQMVQESIKQIEGVDAIDNELEVDWS